jgi:hypothetical protein
MDGSGINSNLEVSVSSRMTQLAADLGYVSVNVVSLDATLAPAQSLKRVTQIRMGALPTDGVVAISDDEIIWRPITRLRSLSLPTGQDVGYYVDTNGLVVILTSKAGSLGIRKQRTSLSIQQWANQMTPGSATRLQIGGLSGEDPVRISVLGSETVCKVSGAGVLSAIESGTCAVSAVQGGGSMFMSAIAETKIAEVNLLNQLRETVIKYNTSLSMVALIVLLTMFLIWQFIQTVVQVRLALRTDPGAL